MAKPTDSKIGNQPLSQPQTAGAHGAGASAPFGAHDHMLCRSAGLSAAEDYCRDHDLRLTPARRHALDLLLSSHRAMGAYEVLEGLAAEGLGSQPPAAYRALEFLTQNGLAHRIERLNAYVACPHPRHAHSPAFLICRTCRAVEEAASAAVRTTLSEAAGASGFQIEGLVIEALGLCPACAASPESAAQQGRGA